MARSVKSSVPWSNRRMQASSSREEAGLRAPGGARLPSVPSTFTRPGRADEANTIRVSNLSEDVTETDLGDLFSEYGFVQAVRLLRDKVTNISNRVAFVTFASRKDAEEAMKRAQGRGLDHLIMHLEWSKPSTGSYK